ncbi:flagellar basal body L-ring protein FlgH [Hephaestia sp. GCM10023244]|uniref:flagellar basal body L-ring protein FlgH n=1 Tax=unclassified Hephaestia TaxID=2631281 RepID=UPI0020776471|nr:flagellar basal body L-ring protein FlgH [Hephaestia sp. MAHUQ-44]MCM8731241.1 flagellar basal body L-ring protein FlgH [Hephaestia sp. MAHUQ-44]
MRTLSALSLGIAAVAFVAAGATPAHAEKKPHEDYSLTLPPPPPPPPADGAIFQADYGYAALHEGWKARRVGDPLTIVLVERTVATKSSTSQLDSKGQFGLVPPTTGALSLFSESDATLGGKRGFDGKGSAGQANALSGEISVTVAQVFPNGTMLVQGEKRVTLNRGDEFVQIKGIVRIADIDANNRVASTRVADARISYTGKGDIARASRQGWLSRFFQIISPF